MSTAASLVVGWDGSSTKAGASRGVSSQIDRSTFLTRRRGFDVILIGGNTARNEPYANTPVPLVVISNSPESPVASNPKAHVWRLAPALAIARAQQEFGSRILVEGGVALITELLANDLIDEFFLTVTQEGSGENFINWREVLDTFTTCEKNEIDGTVFYHAFN